VNPMDIGDIALVTEGGARFPHCWLGCLKMLWVKAIRCARFFVTKQDTKFGA